MVKRGIKAAEAAAENLELFVSAVQAFDHQHMHFWIRCENLRR